MEKWDEFGPLEGPQTSKWSQSLKLTEICQLLRSEKTATNPESLMSGALDEFLVGVSRSLPAT